MITERTIFIEVYCYSKGFSKCHVAMLFETSALNNFRKLFTMLIPKFKNKDFAKSSCAKLIYLLYFVTVPHFSSSMICYN